MTFKPFPHHTVEIVSKGSRLASVTITTKRHTGKEDTYGLTVQKNGRTMSDRWNYYWEVREALEAKGYNLDEVYFS